MARVVALAAVRAQTAVANEAVEAPGSWRGEPAAMRGGGVRQMGRAVATKEEEEAPRNCIASISSQSSRLGRAQATLAFGDEVLDRQN